jgi:hypothetical protein
MNQRYAGDGPKGQTRKSAAKLKPASEAAASVHIDKKPVTKAEKKAAAKKREKQQARKIEERNKHAAEREKAEKIASGEITEAEANKVAKPQNGLLQTIKGFFANDSGLNKNTKVNKPNVPNTPEYKKFKRIYWVLMAIGIAAVATSFIIQFTVHDVFESPLWMVPMGIAYVSIIAAIVLDYAKIRRMAKAHVKNSDTGKMSPKQIKHIELKN